MAITVPLDQLDVALALILSRLDGNISKLVRITAYGAGQEGARRTPVDTGEARSNWTLTINSRFTGTRPPYYPYPKAFSSIVTAPRFYETANLNGTLNQFRNALRGYTDYRKQALISIANSVEHIEELDDGTASPQAPGGMTRYAVIAGVQVFRSRAVRVLSRGLP